MSMIVGLLLLVEQTERASLISASGGGAVRVHRRRPRAVLDAGDGMQARDDAGPGFAAAGAELVDAHRGAEGDQDHEYRVGLTPAGARSWRSTATRSLVEADAGMGIGWTDDAYRAAGATVAPTADERFRCRRHDREGQGAAAGRDAAAAPRPGPVHLPAPRRRPGADRGAAAKAARTCIAYETVTDRRGRACRCWRR